LAYYEINFKSSKIYLATQVIFTIYLTGEKVLKKRWNNPDIALRSDNAEPKSLNSILNKVLKDIGVERGLREIAFMNMWSEIVGPRFKDNSKVVSIKRKSDHDVLLVAVSSSVVSQELFLYKKDILRKLSHIALTLEFNIKDLIFSTKLWAEKQESSFINNKQDDVHFFKVNPTNKELEEISVPETIIDSIKSSINTQNFSSPELKGRMLNTIIKDIKTQIWRKNKGFPSCVGCGIPINYYNPNKEKLCPSCEYIVSLKK